MKFLPKVEPAPFDPPVEEPSLLLVWGNPSDGFTYMGPMDPDDPGLENWIEKNLEVDWWYIPLKKPGWK